MRIDASATYHSTAANSGPHARANTRSHTCPDSTTNGNTATNADSDTCANAVSRWLVWQRAELHLANANASSNGYTCSGACACYHRY